jgi:EXS family
VMDWGMMKNPSAAASVACCGAKPPVRLDQPRSLSCWHVLLRQRLRFGIAMSVVILFTDAILRFSWTLRFYTNLFPSMNSVVLCTQFLEIFRRSIWNLLRVEWENLKQSGAPNNNNKTHHHHHNAIPSIASMTSLTNRQHQYLHHHASGGSLEFTALASSNTNANGTIGGNNKDDDEKVRLIVQRSHANNKVKP